MEFIKALKPEEIKQAIKNACIDLDSLCTDWYKKNDIEKLDMTSNFTCILGQLYGDHFKNCKSVLYNNPIFYVNGTEKIWIEEIKNRLIKNV